jgi:hypothetical protein
MNEWMSLEDEKKKLNFVIGSILITVEAYWRLCRIKSAFFSESDTIFLFLP